MFQTFDKIKRFLRRHCPYRLQSGAPDQLKQLWKGLLRKQKKRYWVVHLYTQYVWQPLYNCSRILGIKQNSNHADQLVVRQRHREMTNSQIPVYYFQYFSFAIDKNWNKRQLYLYHLTLVHCLDYIAESSQSILLNDKLKFFSFCKANDLPSPEVYKEGELKNSDSKYPWNSKRDFIIKPVFGFKAMGFQCYLYEKESEVYLTDQRRTRIASKSIIEHLSTSFNQTEQQYLIQEKVRNHDFFTGLSNEALCVIRILSMVNKEGGISLFRPIVQLPQGTMETAYYHLGAQSHIVDLDSGALGPEIGQLHYDEISAGHHSNRILPYWNEIKNLLRMSHSKLNEIPLIGWDVAISPKGPMLIEGNVKPSLDLHQLEPYGPFISSDFYDLFIYHLGK